MQTPTPKESPTILVEFGGTRKEILKEKLPQAQEMEAYMQATARKAGLPEQEIEEMYTLRIVKDEP